MIIEELAFRGSVWDFVNVMRDLQEKIYEEADTVFIEKTAYHWRSYRGEPAFYVTFGNPKDDDDARSGTIKVARGAVGSDTSSWLTVDAPDEFWDELKIYWERVRDEIVRRGFVSTDKVSGPAIEHARPAEAVAGPAEKMRAPRWDGRSTINFTVNAEWRHFENLLRRLTRKHFGDYLHSGIPGAEGENLLYPLVDLRPALDHAGERRIYQPCCFRRSIAVKGKAEVETLTREQHGVEYVLTTLAENSPRTAVMVRLREPRMLEPLTRVLLEIANKYMESRLDILRQLDIAEAPLEAKRPETPQVSVEIDPELAIEVVKRLGGPPETLAEFMMATTDIAADKAGIGPTSFARAREKLARLGHGERASSNRRPYGIRGGTIEAIERLMQQRKENKAKGRHPGRVKAYGAAGTSSNTILNYVPEINDKWDDWDSGWEADWEELVGWAEMKRGAD